MFIVLLTISESLATKCLSLNDEPCMVRPIYIDLSLFELKYCSSMISLDKCNGSVMPYLQKCVFLKKGHKC